VTNVLKTEKTAELAKLVDNSGFPFQLRIEHEVRTSTGHSWSIASREHPWVERGKEKEYFLDLILESGRQRMAIECKRTQNASWIFLTNPAGLPEPEVGRPQIKARVFYASRLPGGELLQTWWDFDVRPSTVASDFCVIRGTGDDQSPLLERLGRHVVDASREVGEMALSLGESADAVVVIPVIVTNAKLYACPVDPGRISLDEGRFVGAEARFVELPYIRFQKSLSQEVTKARQKPRNVWEADKNRERTVFIVNSESLIPMMKTWTLRPLPGEGWPHDVLPG
jgi:hypothetical protein